MGCRVKAAPAIRWEGSVDWLEVGSLWLLDYHWVSGARGFVLTCFLQLRVGSQGVGGVSPVSLPCVPLFGRRTLTTWDSSSPSMKA